MSYDIPQLICVGLCSCYHLSTEFIWNATRNRTARSHLWLQIGDFGPKLKGTAYRWNRHPVDTKILKQFLNWKGRDFYRAKGRHLTSKDTSFALDQTRFRVTLNGTFINRKQDNGWMIGLIISNANSFWHIELQHYEKGVF